MNAPRTVYLENRYGDLLSDNLHEQAWENLQCPRKQVEQIIIEALEMRY